MGEDYEAIAANWATGYQAFLDGTIDVHTNGFLDPGGQSIQFTETEEIRFIGQFRHHKEVSADSYEGQVNDRPVLSFNTSVGIGVRADMNEETVHQVTRTFWKNLDQISSEAAWVEGIDTEFAVSNPGQMTIRPGAAQYYREVGAME